MLNLKWVGVRKLDSLDLVFGTLLKTKKIKNKNQLNQGCMHACMNSYEIDASATFSTPGCDNFV